MARAQTLGGETLSDGVKAHESCGLTTEAGVSGQRAEVGLGPQDYGLANWHADCWGPGLSAKIQRTDLWSQTGELIKNNTV